ncbi:MAG: LCP family protein [bacterium]|nr:LCP family protein [bacterium]
MPKNISENEQKPKKNASAKAKDAKPVSNKRSVKPVRESKKVQKTDDKMDASVKESIAKTNLEIETGTSEQQRNGKTWMTWKKGVIIGILGIGILFVGLSLNKIISTTKNIIDSDNPTPLLEQLGIIIGGEDRPLRGENEDRINVLLLGIGGDGHAGGTLTDSIMIASFQPSTNQVSLLSLPRDLVVKIYDDENPKLWEGRKINFAYELGGMNLAKEKVTEVTGLDLHYYVLIDFAGFRKLIDDVDGVSIDIERSFTGLYGANELSLPCPTAQLYYLTDGAYCAIPFKRGVETMDGETALIFSRIRKLAPGSLNPEEGSDFARGQRQQKILESFKEKVLSTNTLLHLGRVNDILDSLGDHLETNMEIWEMMKFADLVSNVSNEDIISRVVDDSPQGLVYSKIYEPTGAYVLVPQAGEYNFSEITLMAKNVFENAETAKEQSTLQILNATTQNGLAARTAETLQAYDVDVIDVGNAPDQTMPTTKIYDLTMGEKKLTLDLLLELVDGTVASEQQTNELLETDPDEDFFDSSADFIIILGNNVSQTSP